MFSLPFLFAFIGSAVGLLFGILIYSEIADSIHCPPIEQFLGGLGLVANADEGFGGDVVVYHSFDSSQNIQSGNLNNIFVNQGSYGHDADLFGLDKFTHTYIDFIPEGDYAGGSIIGDGSVRQGDVLTAIFGNWNHEDQWKFLMDDQTEKYSINFWVYGLTPMDVDELFTEQVGFSLLGVLPSVSTNSYNGFNIYWLDDGTINVSINNEDQPVFNVKSINLNPPETGTLGWTMVTFVIDKSNSGTIYINGSNPVTVPVEGIFTPITDTQGQIDFIDGPLALLPTQFSGQGLANTGDFYTPFNVDGEQIDDLCIIKDYIFSQDDLDALFNNGEGMACIDGSNSGTSTVEVPFISQYDAFTGGGSAEVYLIDPIPNSSDPPHDFAIGTVQQFSQVSQNIKNMRVFITNSFNTGTLQAVILTNLTHPNYSPPAKLKGDEVLLATSDLIDFANLPAYAIPVSPFTSPHDYFVTLNFTSDIGNFNDDFTSNNIWSVQGANNGFPNNFFIAVNVTSGKLDYDIFDTRFEYAVSYDFLNDINSTNWILRYKLTVDNLVQGIDTEPVMLIMGIGDQNTGYGSIDAQNILGLRYVLNATQNRYEIFDTSNSSPDSTSADAIFSHTPIPETLYVEIELDSPTYQVTLFSDPSYTIPIETESGTTSLNSFRYIKIFNHEGGGLEDHIFNGIIDDLQVISTRIYPSALVNFNSADIFIGLNATGIDVLTLDQFSSGQPTGMTGIGGDVPICVDNSNPSALWDICSNYGENVISSLNSFYYEINVDDYNIPNGQIGSINFVGNGEGGNGEVEGGNNGNANEKCNEAKDLAWTVIGILPVGLFFGLFALFSAVMPKQY